MRAARSWALQSVGALGARAGPARWRVLLSAGPEMSACVNEGLAARGRPTHCVQHAIVPRDARPACVTSCPFTNSTASFPPCKPIIAQRNGYECDCQCSISMLNARCSKADCFPPLELAPNGPNPHVHHCGPGRASLLVLARLVPKRLAFAQKNRPDQLS